MSGVRRGWVWLVMVTLTMPGGAALAESLDTSVSWRGRLELWDWFDPSGDFDDSYAYFAYLLRAGVGQQLEKLDWLVELSQPTLIGLPTNAVAPPPQGELGLGGTYYAVNGGQDATLFPKQVFARFKGLHGNRGALRLGRFEFWEGGETNPGDPMLAALKRSRIAHRLLGNFGFSHVQRSLDGIQWAWDQPDLNVTLLAARPVEGVFDLSGWNELRVRILYGAVTMPFSQLSEGRLFLLNTRDSRNVVKVDNRPLPERQADTGDVDVTTLGGHYLQAWDTGKGRSDLLLWGGLQWGRWGDLDHQAWGWAIEAGHRFDDQPWQPWVRLGWNRTSGDGDPGDGDHLTFFQHLPTPRVYARFPFYNLMNTNDLFVQVSGKPSKQVSFRSDFHWLELTSGGDLWYAGGGAFNDKVFGYGGRPSGGKRSLAKVIDLSVDYQVSQGGSLGLYAAYAHGGSVIDGIYDGRDGAFAYLEWTQRW